MPLQTVIISIGNELLNGETLDTNSYWISSFLQPYGIDIVRKYTIEDTKEALVELLDKEIGQVSTIIMTGGLGPTKDDLTQGILAEYFGSPIEKDEALYEHLKQLFIKRRGLYEEHNLQQAWVPTKARVIKNGLGTAPGTCFEKQKTTVVSLPGVPFEMKAMMKEEVLPLLLTSWEINSFKSVKTLLVAGKGESDIAHLLNDWEAQLSDAFTLAYLPNLGLVRLRLQVVTKTQEESDNLLEKEVETLRKALGNHIVSEDGSDLPTVILSLLSKQNKTLGFVESCTGGLFSDEITNIPGASQSFRGSIIAYDNEIKSNVATANAETIEKYGAVSEESVREMALGGQKVLEVDYCLAVSGILGPGGGSEAKPVGTVWLAIAGPEELVTYQFYFGYDRLENKMMTVNYGLNMLRKMLLKGE